MIIFTATDKDHQNMIRADKSTVDQVLTVKKADRVADTGTYRIKLTCEGGR